MQGFATPGGYSVWPLAACPTNRGSGIPETESRDCAARLLEHEVGDRILVRAGRRVELTETGPHLRGSILLPRIDTRDRVQLS